MTTEKKLDNKSWYATKKFWGALLIAIALWTYASLNDNYQTLIDVPLVVKAPKGRAIEDILPNNVSVEVYGNGWYLFNYLFFNKMKKCIVNLNDVRRSDDSIYTISSIDMQKGLTNVNKISPQRFYPDQFNVKTGEIANKEVDIIPDVVINLKDEFVLVGNVKTEPQTVTVTGNSKLIDSIKQWKTQNNVFNGVNASFANVVQVSDSLASVIKVTPRNITVFAAVQQYGEATFDDVELKIVGGTLPQGHTIAPQVFSVTLSGGIELLNKINATDISLTIDYTTIMNDKTGLIKPTISIPPFTKMLSIYPKFLQHNIQINHTKHKI